jgi:signal transduction histidine kinase
MHDDMEDVLTSFDLSSNGETEEARLEALYRYNILDTKSEQAFDHVAQMAAYLFNAPIAAVSLIDKDRHWFKSCIGLEASELSLENSLCARAIQNPGVTVIEDTTRVDEYACMDVVEQAPNIRFYAGAPITTTDGYHIGTLCVLDTKSRERPDEERLHHLKNLANIVVDEMELRLETTRRKKQAQSLRQTAQRAEIARASAENARKRAEQAQRRAEEASSSKSRFLTGMAHDIRSPISAIDGFAQLLQRTSDGPHKQHAERILQATSHLRDMADTLSELAELESGSINLDVEDVSLCPLIHETKAALEGRANEADISLEAATPDSPVYASANPQALRRVVDNLVGNAIKYCASGDRVSIRLYAPSRPDAQICIEISDTGPGIDDEFLDIMFEPFTQRNEDADGSGLGLAVTKELVQAMSGRVEASSYSGDGTTFRVFLPGSRANEKRPTEDD